jgi:hypothetical protein
VKPVWSGDWPIPKVVLQPGLRIRVRLKPEAWLVEKGYKYGIWVYDHPNTATIYINQDQPIEVQRYILYHELGHAVHEAIDIMLEKFPEHVQTISMARLAQNQPLAEAIEHDIKEKVL